LAAGERVRRHDGASLRITGVERRPGPQAVCNIEVQGEHAYEVSNLGLLVHNAGAGNCQGGKEEGPKTPSTLDKWSRKPESLQDQMTLEAARKGAGNKIIDNLGDPEFKGMEKWEYKVKSADGKDSVVHYVRDPKTGELRDFKFKRHSTDTPGNWSTTPDPKSSPTGK
jgi:hypothetical protein